MVESLESRQLLSGTAAAATANAGGVGGGLAPAVIVMKPQILAPSKLTGTYTGNATIAVVSTTIPITLVLSPTSATLTVTGYGQVTVALTTKQFKKMRTGGFYLTAKVAKSTLTLTGATSVTGKTISGAFTLTGKANAAGRFRLSRVMTP